MNLTIQRVREIVAAMRGRSVAVYGDVMLDEFVWGDVSRISPEAPVPVVDIRRESVRLGGAANVLANLRALGVRTALVGVVGADRAGERVRAELRDAGADVREESLITDVSRPTTLKTRIIAHNQLVVRADRERRAHVDGPVEERVVAALRRVLKESDALVVSDYDKGAVTPNVLGEILPAALVTPNHHEALRVTSTEDDTDEGMARAARAILGRLGCGSVLITRGERGMMLLSEGGEPTYVPTAAREVYDVTGAGDTVIATLAASLAAGSTLVEASVLANHAAGVVVGKLGTATASSEELLASFPPEAPC